eukprot:TRINITY_DN22713_c0_g1_i1.p1 TRINITY_DN22713_c0_g1~~TRINITY_DN22713_c0_g1_i1.p1  ORF type:complete len:351 (+),score=49.64 TRINITY_DN22713_c0_g1_i1:73-1125(+)
MSTASRDSSTMEVVLLEETGRTEEPAAPPETTGRKLCFGIAGVLVASAVAYVLWFYIAPHDPQPPPGRSRPVPSNSSTGSFCNDGDGWEEVFKDEFEDDGFHVDPASWTKVLSNGTAYKSRVQNSCGTSRNVFQKDGKLVLQSTRLEEDLPGCPYQFSTGAVHTLNKKSWKGVTRVCVKAKLPGTLVPGKTQGIRSAIWLIPADDSCNPSHGEMDVMEHINGSPKFQHAYHWGPPNTCHEDRIAYAEPDTGHNFFEEFLEYGVEYTPTRITFAVNGLVTYSIDTDTEAYHKGSDGWNRARFFSDVPYYLVLNTGVGGSWAGPVANETEFPVQFLFDYVKVTQETKPPQSR